MNFQQLVNEAMKEYAVRFCGWENPHGKVDAYSVVSGPSAKGYMYRIESNRNLWRGSFDGLHFAGTKAAVANWVLDRVVNQPDH